MDSLTVTFLLIPRNFLLLFRLYHVGEGKITLSLNATICGDFTVTLYHARNVLKGIGRPQGIKICQFQMHSGFIPAEETLLNFDKSELDEIADNEHIPSAFNVSVAINVNDTERPPAKCPWTSMKSQRSSMVLFSSQQEYNEMYDNFSKLFWLN